MKRRPLLWQLYPLQLFITITALLAVTWYVSQSIRDFHLQQSARDLASRAELIIEQVAHYLSLQDLEGLQSFCKKSGRSSHTRITVIKPNGDVVADSQEEPSRMDNHGDRPEVIAALAGKLEPAIRYSNTLHENMMYVATAFSHKDKQLGVIRTSIPVSAIDKALYSIYLKIFLVVIIVTILAAIGALISVRHIGTTLNTIRKGAEQFAQGDFSRKLVLPQTKELAGLAESLNRMAEQLNDRLQSVIRQRNELEAVFSSMVEGVLVFDTDEKVISINNAAASLINAHQNGVQGKNILEVIRNSDLLQFVKQTLKSNTSIEGEIVLPSGKNNIYFQAHGVPLKDPFGNNLGGLIVLNDVSRIRRLEKVRRDFVANVSHELRTPITSIKGFVETLLDGALDDPDHAKKFLQIIAGQTERLNDIIDDLLTLSRVEQQADKSAIDLIYQPLSPAIQSAIEACLPEAEKKNIHITCNNLKDVHTAINKPMLEQALINLIDNAVKYSPNGSMVEINIARSNATAIIQVKDNGKGISPEHLPRLFERFYRADASRSNKVHGSGLGLSIVKHIIQAHNGRVTVTSKEGEGSTFIVHLPI